MIIERLSHLRIRFAETGISGRKGHMEHFFDVNPVEEYKGYAIDLMTWEGFAYCVIVRYETTPREIFRHHIMFFPSGKWYREWLESQNPKPTVIWEHGYEEPG